MMTAHRDRNNLYHYDSSLNVKAIRLQHIVRHYAGDYSPNRYPRCCGHLFVGLIIEQFKGSVSIVRFILPLPGCAV